MAEQGSQLPHKLTLDERTKLSMTGATEVVRFDEDTVELNTSRGAVIVQGQGLKLKCLSLDDGAVVIQGQIQAVFYEEPRRGKGLFR